MGFKAGYRGFLDFAETVGLALEPFQRKIARAAEDVREARRSLEGLDAHH